VAARAGGETFAAAARPGLHALKSTRRGDKIVGMKAYLAVFALATAAWPQTGGTAAQPPAEVDKALRERVAQFYQDHVNGKYRDAEELVAPDTKDYYYASGKPQYLSFEISRITYSDNFTRATVVTVCKEQVLAPGFAGLSLPMPVTSDWKLEEGKWYWWVDQESPQDTPFGKMAPLSLGLGPEVPPELPATFPTTPDFALNKIKPDKQSLALKPGGSGEVTFTNTAQGAMSVVVRDTPGGLEVTPARADLPESGKATFAIKVLPDARSAQSATLTFQVQPTGEIIELKIGIE
jgi:hypothetical protein